MNQSEEYTEPITCSISLSVLEISSICRMAKLLEPILADTDTVRQKRMMTGNGSIVGTGAGGLATNDITVVTTGPNI